MSTSVHSGEEGGGHTSTEQWQSFEMRMRRRRLDRLLARASEACDAGEEETAREALAEIAQLSPFEPRLDELRARLNAVSSAGTITPPAFVTVGEAVPELQRPDEITSSNAARSFAVETPTTPIEVATLSIGPSSIEPQLRVDESLIDLPLVIDDTDETESTAAGGEEWHVGRQFGIAAAALIACGALGWFVGPKMTTLVETAHNVVAEWPSAATRAPEADAAPTSGEPAPREPLPPVHVAVDEVAAATTIDTPPSAPEPGQPETTEPAAIAEPAPVPPPPVEPARAESRSDSAVLAAARPEPAPPTAPPAPVSTLPHTPTVEKSATLPPLAENNRPTIPAAPPPVTNEPPAAVVSTATLPASAPAPDTAAAVRDEQEIRSVLDQYAAAYSRLDASAASAIFPGVDRRALARAFDGLAAQSVHLGACDVRIAIESAIVDCTGSATWTPKIGGGSRTEPRRWQFRLRNMSGAWQMVGAKVR